MDLAVVPEGIPEGLLYRVRSMVVSDFHPAAIVDQIERTEGVRLSIQDVAAFAASIPERIDLPSLKDEFGGNEPISDPLAEAHKALLTLGSRIAIRMKAERGAEKMDNKVDSLLMNYSKLAMDMARLMRELGVDPWEKKSKSNERSINIHVQTLRDLLLESNETPIDGEYTAL